MTLRETILHATRTGDVRRVSRIMDILRFRHGCTYADTRGIFERAGINAEDFEDWCQQCDEAETATA